uniref:GYF domain-containing protein n=1 Tax=Odontella aurita TaxID=265563 RepID=A0A7S4JTE0_9STRA
MDAERDSGLGYFDGDTFVFRQRGQGGDDDGKADSDEEDAWVDGLEKKAGEEGADKDGPLGGRSKGGAASGEAFLNRISKKRKAGEGEEGEGEEDLTSRSREELYADLSELIAGDDETVVGALRRYGDIIRRAKKSSTASRYRRKRDRAQAEAKATEGEDVPSAGSAAAAAEAARKSLGRLTSLADALLGRHDDGDVYDRTKGQLRRMAGTAASSTAAAAAGASASPPPAKRRNYFSDSAASSEADKAKTDDGFPASAAPSPKAEIKWEYRGNADSKLHGPYTTTQMMQWTQAGYFVGEAAVDVRMVRAEDDDDGAETKAAAGAGVEKDDKAKEGEEKKKDTADDLMADLMESDEDEDNEDAEKEQAGKDNEDGKGGAAGEKGAIASNGEWRKSDAVDFASYL